MGYFKRAVNQLGGYGSAFQHAAQKVDILSEGRVARAQLFDFFDCMHYGRVVTPAKPSSDFRQGP